ncbi:MAG: hypothetical protein H0X30_08975 [Anaerolineae bacterium]|nr:hypothetical protein [Anaerolineae bacterium]
MKQPLNATLPRVEAYHQRQLQEDAAALPFLKAFMQDAAAHAKPVALNGFPLTARPQHLPNSVHNRSVICWWSAAAQMRFGLGQQATEAAPQWAWNVNVIDIFRFLGKLFVHDISARIGVWRLQPLADMSSFSTPIGFTDRY